MAFISNIEVNEQGYGVRAVAIPSGTVDSTSTSTAFTATVPGIKELRDGVCCFIKNGKVTSASGCTLNINGLGAKPIYNSMAAASAVTTTFNTAYTMLFVYDSTRVSGGCWVMYYGYSAGYTNNVSQGQGYATCSTAVGTAAKTAALSSYALVAHGICSVLFTNGNTAANPTLNINGKGAKAIYYKGAACPTNLIKAGDIVTMIYNTQYHIVSIYSGKEYAPLESPEFTGTPTAPTPSVGDNGTRIPNTGWVQSEITSALGDISGAMHFKGSALQTLTDGGTENASSSVAGSEYLGDAGDVYLQYNDNTKEFIWTGAAWELLGDEEKDIIIIHASPTGQVMQNQPTFSLGMTLEAFEQLRQHKIVFLTADSYPDYNCLQVMGKDDAMSELYTKWLGVEISYYNLNCIPHQDYDGRHSFTFSSVLITTEGICALLSQLVNFIIGANGEGYYVDIDGRLNLNYANDTDKGIITLGASGGAATYEHTHGTLNNDGTISATATAASGDGIIMVDASDHDKLVIGPLFGTATNTYLCNDGTWKTPTDSDTKVTQNTNTTVNSNLPILLGYTPTTGATTNTVNKAAGFYYNPSTKKLYVNSVEAKLTDTNNAVAQNAAITTNGDYPILLGSSTATTLVTASVNKASTLTFNPSTKVLKVNGVSMEPITWTVS